MSLSTGLFNESAQPRCELGLPWLLYYKYGVRKTWARALKDAQIEFFPIYNLRATFASRLSAAGVPDVFVSQMMGHAGGLLQTYAKAITEYRRDAIRKLEAYRESSGENPYPEKKQGEVLQ